MYLRVTCLFVCNILTFVDWWVKWKIGSWSLQIWLKNTLYRDLPMMKLLLLFNEFFLYLNDFHRNLTFLEQTCTFLHLLTQLSSLSYVCFIRCGIFNFAATFLFCRGFFILPWLFVFLPWLFYFCRDFFCFAVTFLFCCDFLVLSWLFGFAVAFWFCRGFLVLPWRFGFIVAFCFYRGVLVLSWHLWATVASRFHFNTINREYSKF